MAEPKAKRTTVRYLGGSVTASLGAIEKLLGTQVLGWNAPLSTGAALKRRPYASTRVSRAAAGQAAEVSFSDGEVWTFRVTGPQKNFLRNFLNTSSPNNVTAIKFPRKTKYSPVPQTLVP
jgi:hypothetical protein